MHKSKLFPLLASGLLLLGACVTINVYFPAAEVNAAAQQFVEDVISGTPSASAVVVTGSSAAASPGQRATSYPASSIDEVTAL